MSDLGRSRWAAWAATISMVAAMSLAAGCGDDEDDHAAKTPPQNPKGAIAKALNGIVSDLAAGNGAGVCGALSRAAAIEVATAGYGRLARCEDVIEAIAAKRGKRDGKALRYEVVSARRDGARATALVRTPGERPRYFGFTQASDGTWRLPGLESLAPDAVRPPPEGPGSDFSDPAQGGAKAKIREVIYDLQGDFPRGLGDSVCFELSAAGRREVEASGIGKGECADRIPEIARRALANGIGPRSSKILSVEVDGGRATAVLRDPGGPPYRAHLTFGPEYWKMARLHYVTGADLEQLR